MAEFKEQKNRTDQKDSHKVLISAVDLGGKTVDLNSDLGEGFDTDEGIMPFISSANIACGYHAGDEKSIRKTIALAAAHHVSIGAHPSFDDRKNFGRVEMDLGEDEIYDLVTKQILIIRRIAEEEGSTLHHVKPHGALYNMASTNAVIARAVVRAVIDIDENLVVYGLSGSKLISEANAFGLRALNEVFADRNYNDDGSLVSRKDENALVTNSNQMVQQVLQMVRNGMVTTVSGLQIPILAETICIHSDSPNAIEMSKRLNETLKSEDIGIRSA